MKKNEHAPLFGLNITITGKTPLEREQQENGCFTSERAILIWTILHVQEDHLAYKNCLN